MPKKANEAPLTDVATTQNLDELVAASVVAAMARHDERTMEPRAIILTGTVGPDMVKDAAEKLTVLTERSLEPITVIIATSGGLAVYGWALYDLFTTNDAPVLTIGYGIIASAGVVALLGGRQRLLSPNTRFIVHEITRELENGPDHSADALAQTVNVVRSEERQMARLIVRETGNPLDQVRAWMRTETHFTAKRAVALGFADGLLKENPRPKKAPKSAKKAKKRPRKA